MTAHVHDPAVHDESTGPAGAALRRDSTMSARPRWLLPGVLVAVIVAGLVVAGVLSLSSVLYAGLFGGMILMHTGGHGHGGHAGGGHAGHGDGTTNDAEDLRQGSSRSQPVQSGSDARLEERAAKAPMTSEKTDHDQHGSHGCH